MLALRPLKRVKKKRSFHKNREIVAKIEAFFQKARFSPVWGRFLRHVVATRTYRLQYISFMNHACILNKMQACFILFFIPTVKLSSVQFLSLTIKTKKDKVQ